jgi:hypothetical protein
VVKMKFTLLSLTFLAALVSAEHLHQRPHHFHHRRHLNVTSTSVEESTTLTVFQTLVRTVTSCAPTVTNCPARSATEVGVVTEIIALTTTVCPVTAAAAVSSSLAAVASSTIKAPLDTGVMNPEASDTTLTYMLGTGSSTTVITTTIKRTTTSTEYFTQYITRSQVLAAAETGYSGGQTSAAVAGSEPTTTITQLSTLTKYVTVKRVSTASPTASVSPFIGVIAGSTESENGACVPQTVTVALSTVTVPQTVTVAMSTVTVVRQFYHFHLNVKQADKIQTYTQMGESPSAAPPAAQSESTIVEAQYAAVTSVSSSSFAPYRNGSAPATKPVGTRFLTKLKSTTVMGEY